MIVPTEELGTLAGTVTMVSGGFDPLHPGHLAYFRAAADLGAPLLVNVSSDDWVVQKHPPLLTQAERMQLIDALEMVEYVHAEQGPTAEVLELLRPRIFAKGADWEGRLPEDEQAVCAEHGVEIVFLDTVIDSSTDVLRRFISSLGDGMSTKAAAELVSALTPVRELDYPRHPIKLVVSSPEIRRRLGSVEKEPFTVEWIESTLGRGDVLYDIGANVGPYSLIAAKATAGGVRVFAFEPSPASFRDLAQNIELNDCVESITPIPFALWSETGLLPVRWKSRKAGAARHRLGKRTGAEEGPVTLGMRLDDAVEGLGIPPPTHAKIDVDGHEVDVLRGAERTLRRPEWRSILIELDRRETDRNREIRELLVAGGFDEGVRQERTASRRYPDPKRRPDVYWIFTRAASAT